VGEALDAWVKSLFSPDAFDVGDRSSAYRDACMVCGAPVTSAAATTLEDLAKLGSAPQSGKGSCEFCS
jgi:hypothetical protein